MCYSTWDVENGIPLFKAGKISHNNVSSSRIDTPQVLIGGGPHFAIPSGKEVRVYSRQTGRDFRCLASPGIIPSGSPMVWAHGGTCIIAALEHAIVLLQIEKRHEATLSIEGVCCVQGFFFARLTVSAGCLHTTHLAVSWMFAIHSPSFSCISVE